MNKLDSCAFFNLAKFNFTHVMVIEVYLKKTPWLESAGANYTDRATAACRQS
jgi:hypothetical protein